MSGNEGRPEVRVTGIGAVSCLGPGADAFWAGLRAPAGPPAAVPGLTERVPDALAYQVPGRWPADGAPGRYGRTTEFALHAAREAVADAGLDADEIADMAVVIGTAGGETGERDGVAPGEAGRSEQDWSPTFPVASAVGGELGAFGPNISVSNACAASGYALSVAMDLVRRGEAETVLVGGAESLAWVPLAAFSRLGVNDPSGCRPFDLGRRGTVFGEGAAMLVVQSARAAAGRPGYGRLLGTAWSCDAHHPTSPDPAGRQLVRVAEEALREAGLGPDAVDCVIPHGTGTRQNDVVEATVLREVLGGRADDVPLFSLKAFLGHSAGSAAAFAAVCAALMARHGELPANVPLVEQDPECPLWLPQAGAVPLDRPTVLVNAYGFGGNNFSMVFGGEAR
ncbi:beta-ketoacyl synthase N-terminal-like domain-containing protein [Kitasatospora sp. NPDC097643]|uniref:beta-ketoacyl-[acyl-carrier-protein] synthase family protein n=1 Tax=Kitasatospora sp. NPDC097643 TaxID=3157230 RepID=UPI003324B834